MVIAVDLDESDLAELAFLDDLFPRLGKMRGAAPLRADLNHFAMFTSRGQHGLALGDVDADRLLHVDVGARLDSGDHRQGVPMVGSRDQHKVEILLLEHLAIVGIGPRRLLRRLAVADKIRSLGEHVLIDVAQRDDLDGGDLDQADQIALAIPAAADQADAFGFEVP